MEKKNYIVDEVNKTVTRTIVSKGQEFTAKATADELDVFNPEVGKAIVDFRLELLQRKRDLTNTRQVILDLKEKIKEETLSKERKDISKHWMMSLQYACEERDSQLNNIKFVKEQLELLTSGVKGLVIASMILNRRFTIKEAKAYAQ